MYTNFSYSNDPINIRSYLNHIEYQESETTNKHHYNYLQFTISFF